EVLSLLGCDPAREAFSHPAARRPLAAAVALLSSTRPTAEALAQALAAAPLGDARCGDLAVAATRLPSEAPLPGATGRTLKELASQQQAAWTARLAVVAPLEAEARAVALATAAVDLSWKGDRRLRYEQAHRRALAGALRALRTEQARRWAAEESAWSS